MFFVMSSAEIGAALSGVELITQGFCVVFGVGNTVAGLFVILHEVAVNAKFFVNFTDKRIKKLAARPCLAFM